MLQCLSLSKYCMELLAKLSLCFVEIKHIDRNIKNIKSGETNICLSSFLLWVCTAPLCRLYCTYQELLHQAGKEIIFWPLICFIRTSSNQYFGVRNMAQKGKGGYRKLVHRTRNVNKYVIDTLYATMMSNEKYVSRHVGWRGKY